MGEQPSSAERKIECHFCLLALIAVPGWLMSLILVENTALVGQPTRPPENGPDVGWGIWGFKAGPIGGKSLSELSVTGKVPEPIRPFSLTRFSERNPVGEKAAAAVSH
jgi:hypothetical protein